MPDFTEQRIRPAYHLLRDWREMGQKEQDTKRRGKMWEDKEERAENITKQDAR